MADGGYRFPTTGQHFYNNQSQPQNNFPRQILGRAGSPHNNSRVGETASPSRSTSGTTTPAFGMYGIHQNQQSLLNGRYHMQMNLSKQHYPNQQNAGQEIQNGYGNHQHNMSTGGGLSSATPHFTPSHMQSSTPVGAPQRSDSEFWQQQLRVVQVLRDVSQNHFYARVINSGSKQTLPTSLHPGFKEDDQTGTTNSDGQPWRSLDMSGGGLRTLSSKLFEYAFLDKLYLSHNKLNWLSPQISQLRFLTFLDLSQNQLESIPPQIGLLVNLKAMYLFDNNISSLPSEMGYLYQLEFLGIEGNPLSDDIRGIMAETGTKELITWLRETASEPDPPAERDWVDLNTTTTSEDRFTVFDANILCPKYVTASQYPYVPKEALNWETRKSMVLRDLKNRNADIICLQEIDAETFNEEFRGKLAIDDYKGVFWQKSRAQTMNEREAKLVDGCATFWKNNKYILLDKQIIDFRKMAINRTDMKGEHDIFNRVMTRDDIASVTFLENRATGSRIIVVNTHVFWNPEFADVKIVQIAILLDNVARLAETYAKWPACKDKDPFKYANGDADGAEVVKQPAPSMQYNASTDIPLLMCGDLNSTPGSGPYELLSHASLPSTHPDLTGRSYGSFTRDGMRHPFSLKSAYGNIGELEFTNYTATWQGVVDYIWYSTNSLQNTGLLGDIDKNYIDKIPGFPSHHFPSDHLPLFAEFVVKQRKERKAVDAS